MRKHELKAAIEKHEAAAERYEKPGHGGPTRRAAWCAYQRQLAAWLRELNDIQHIAWDGWPGPVAPNLHASRLRDAAEEMVNALRNDGNPNSADHIEDAATELENALRDPDDGTELETLRHHLRLADEAINALCVHTGPEQQRKWKSRDAVRAYRTALPHPITGKSLGPALLAAGGLAAALHQPGAVPALALAIDRCRCGGEPNSVSAIAARVLEAVLAQHDEETDAR